MPKPGRWALTIILKFPVGIGERGDPDLAELFVHTRDPGLVGFGRTTAASLRSRSTRGKTLRSGPGSARRRCRRWRARTRMGQRTAGGQADPRPRRPRGRGRVQDRQSVRCARARAERQCTSTVWPSAITSAEDFQFLHLVRLRDVDHADFQSAAVCCSRKCRPGLRLATCGLGPWPLFSALPRASFNRHAVESFPN